MNFKISRIEGGVFAREVNPYGESQPKKYTVMVRDVITTIEYDKWFEAERQLREYQLTEGSQDTIFSQAMYSKDSAGKTFGEIALGKLISGKLVEENGVKKIKI